MNLDERNEQSTGYRHFRTSLDLGMGVFYVIIGMIIMYVKYFGSIELAGAYAYILGGLMVLYGVFRVYRGFKAMRNRPRRSITRDFPDLVNRDTKEPGSK